jgi:hypothetical protein
MPEIIIYALITTHQILMRKNINTLLKYYKGCFHLHKTGMLTGCYVHDIKLVISALEEQQHTQICPTHSILTTCPVATENVTE